MARALHSLDQAQFSCSICLELLRDPVTIPCGHSYCMNCLSEYWDQQQVSNCPQCRATFSPRPTLGRNTLLMEMMHTLGAVKLSDGPSAPPLYHDLGSAGVRGFEHATFDVSSVRPERTDGERSLGETRRRLQQQIQEKESELQQLKQTIRSFSRLTKAAVKDSSRIFSELLEFVERRRVEMKELIRAQEKAEATRAENQLQRLEQLVSELKRRDGELERVSHTRDQNLITQMCQSFSAPVHSGESSSLVVSPHVSFSNVRTAITDLNEQLQRLYHSEFPSIAAAVKNVTVLQVREESKEKFDPSNIPRLDDRDDLLQHFCPLSLDPFSAHRELKLTEQNRTVSRTGELQSYPDHPDRFDSWGQVLCREGLRGRCYWESEWEGQQVVLGVTYESIKRKGSSNDSRLGHNTLSWCLQCSSSSAAFIHGNKQQPVTVPSGTKTRRIGIFLDHDAGLLCFYTVTPSGVQLLHEVETAFSQPLYPAVWLGAQSAVRLCADGVQ
ncbi:E3 ubiquitin-protein ligase TRIM65-like [Aulostomus maculatus]